MSEYSPQQIIDVFNSGSASRPPQLRTTYGSIFDWLNDKLITMRELTLRGELDDRAKDCANMVRGGDKHSRLVARPSSNDNFCETTSKTDR